MMNSLLRSTLIFLSGTLFEIILKQIYTCSANSVDLTKIVGGQAVSSQTWKWAASLRRSSSNSHFCGGSIISDSHILTAAHCTIGFSSPTLLRVYVGSIDLDFTAQVRDVSKIYNHPSYSSLSYLNDISILKLSSPIDLTQPGVGPVRLPNVSSIALASGEYPTAGVNVMLNIFIQMTFFIISLLACCYWLGCNK
jgi:secreted trypsin-like serine protease